jgi:hypothetical protein
MLTSIWLLQTWRHLSALQTRPTGPPCLAAKPQAGKSLPVPLGLAHRSHHPKGMAAQLRVTSRLPLERLPAKPEPLFPHPSSQAKPRTNSPLKSRLCRVAALLHPVHPMWEPNLHLSDPQSLAPSPTRSSSRRQLLHRSRRPLLVRHPRSLLLMLLSQRPRIGIRTQTCPRSLRIVRKSRGSKKSNRMK